MGPDVEQSKLEHRKQPARARANDHDIRGDGFTRNGLVAHLISFETFKNPANRTSPRVT
jgi:hypothetical protein